MTSTPPDLAMVVDYLNDGKLPVMGLALPESFYTPTAPWLIDPVGPIRGYHAVVGVGVAEIGGSRSIMIRNSWGDTWGNSGHAYLSDSFLANHLMEVMALTSAP